MTTGHAFGNVGDDVYAIYKKEDGERRAYLIGKVLEINRETDSAIYEYFSHIAVIVDEVQGKKVSSSFLPNS